VLVSVIAWVLYGQALDGPGIFGILLIVAGVMIINLFSKAVVNP
jgi:small multidrug resistance pump